MKKLIIWLMALCLLTGCAVQPVATEPTEVQSMAYSNVTPPTLPTWDKSEFPNYALIFAYRAGADVEDWIAVHLLASTSEIYYDTESKCLLTDGTSIYNRYTTSNGAWDGWGDGLGSFDIMPVGLNTFEPENTAINLSVWSAYIRAWTPYDIYDTEGNRWLAAGAASPVVTFPDGVSITPGWEIVVKQGKEHQIQCAVTANGVTLDPTKYTWRVYEGKNVDGEYGLYLTDAVTIDENGLLTVTTNTTTEQGFWVQALDDVLDQQVWLLRTEAFNLQSFLIGYTLGLAGKPLPLAKKTPIAYLYNGVRLPDINTVWTDKETYPFAIIHYHNERQAWYFRTYGAVPVYYESYSIYDDVAVFPNSDTPQRYYKIVDGAWSFYRDAIVDICASFSATAWVSCDVLNEDGTVYLAATEPIPVYE